MGLRLIVRLETRTGAAQILSVLQDRVEKWRKQRV